MSKDRFVNWTGPAYQPPVNPPVTGGGTAGGAVIAAYVPASFGTGTVTGTASAMTIRHLPTGKGGNEYTLGFKVKF